METFDEAVRLRPPDFGGTRLLQPEQPMVAGQEVHTPRTPPELTWIPLSIQLVCHALGSVGRMLERVGGDCDALDWRR